MALSRKPKEIVNDSSNPLLAKHESWERVYVSEVADIVNGYAFQSKKFNSEKGIPLIRIRDVGKKSTKTLYDGEFEEFDERYHVNNGDLLVGLDGDFRCSIWNGGKALLNQRVCKIVLKTDKYDFGFLSYVLQPYLDEIHAETSAVTVKHLSSRTIGEIPLPMPTEQQQKQIVAKIEQLFSHIDAGIEALNTAKQRLKQYRQSVLKAAVTGELSKEWREAQQYAIGCAEERSASIPHAQDALPTVSTSYESSDKLLERILQTRRQKWEQQQLAQFKAKGKLPKNDKWKEKYKELSLISDDELNSFPELPENWLYTRLGNVIEEPKYGTSKKCTYDSSGVGVLRIPNIADSVIDSEDLKYAVFDKKEKEVYQLFEGDILIIRSNGSVKIVGKCALIDEKDMGYLYAGYLIRLRPHFEVVTGGYLINCLSSIYLRNQIEFKAKSTSGVNNINSSEIESLVVAMCSKEEQLEVSRLVDSRLEAVERLGKEIEIQLKKSQKTKQSILASAFSGKLI